MAKRRHKQLWEKVESLTEWTAQERKLLQAICIIAAEATKKGANKKETPSLPFTPQELHQELLHSCNRVVNLTTYSNGSFGRLGRTLHGINGLCREDMTRLAGWMNDGGLDWWDEKPTWDHVVKHIVTWVAKAREWADDQVEDERGTSVR